MKSMYLLQQSKPKTLWNSFYQKRTKAFFCSLMVLFLTLLPTIDIAAQAAKTIKGVVVDEKSESIIGATVSVRGTTNYGKTLWKCSSID